MLGIFVIQSASFLLCVLGASFAPHSTVIPHASDTSAGARIVAEASEDVAVKLVEMICPPDLSADDLGDALLGAGAIYVTTKDPTDKINQALEVGFAPDANVEAMLLDAAAISGLGSLPRFSISTIREKDWVSEVQSDWPPVVIPGCLIIKFPWHSAADVAAAKAKSVEPVDQNQPRSENELELTFKPGQAFGSGEHATTQLCCMGLQRILASKCVKRNLDNSSRLTVLDYGSGSGVLAFAALHFGADQAIGVELDPIALNISKINADTNGFTKKFVPLDPESEAQQPMRYPIVVANILTPIIIELSGLLSSRVAPGGKLLLSGIWGEEQVARVQAAFSGRVINQFEVIYQDGWALLEGTRDVTL